MHRVVCHAGAAIVIAVVGCSQGRRIAVDQTSKIPPSVAHAEAMNAEPIFVDRFDSYADVAAFERVWSKDGHPDSTLDPAFGHDSKQSVKLSGASSNQGTTDRLVHDLSRPLTPSDSSPILFSVDLYLDPVNDPPLWHVMQSIDLRGFEGGHFKAGKLTNVVSLGLCPMNVSANASDYFQCRVFTDESVPLMQQYHSLTDGPHRSPGWHTLTAKIGSSHTLVTVDGQRAGDIATPVHGPFTTVVIGSGVGSRGTPIWCDNIVVSQSADRP